MFPPKKDDGGGSDPSKKPAPKGGPPGGGKPGGPPPPGGGPPQPGGGLHQALMQPAIKPGQGMDPMAAMMGGMGDISHMGPPALPAPGAPMEGGMPIGGGLPSGDPGMDPAMEGSGLFQALNQSLDPFASPPSGHGDLDPMGGGQTGMGLDQLLQLLALSRAGVGGGEMGGGGGPPMGGGLGAGLNPSGQMNGPSNPGQMMGMQNQGLMM